MKGITAVTLVIVVAAIGALVLLLSIVALSRSRFADESERFRYVSDLTSQWSRQQQGKQAAAASGPAAIDLREEPGKAGEADDASARSHSIESR
jgi:hypothetical protein